MIPALAADRAIQEVDTFPAVAERIGWSRFKLLRAFRVPVKVLGVQVAGGTRSSASSATQCRASRSPLDGHYAEHMAAKRPREPEVIVWRGIGQVLGVR